MDDGRSSTPRSCTEQGEWVEAGKLWTRTWIRQADGEYGTVQRVQLVRRVQSMYDLTVEKAHTFVVGDGQWLVHNCTKAASKKFGATLKPGPYAHGSIPARGPGTSWLTSEREAIDSLGAKFGCHTCGARISGLKSNHWILNHQPVSKLNFRNKKQRLYPHCLSCSRRQGGEVNTTLRRWQR
jgi:hypothetical protein